MNESIFIISHYSALALVGLLSYVFGRKLTQKLVYNSRLEQVGFSIALGLGVISYLVFFLGLLGLLYRSVLLIALLVGFLICHTIWLGWPSSLLSALKRLRATSRRSIAFAIVVAIFALALSLYVWILPLYPPTAFDSTAYHLASAKIYARNHRLVPTNYLWYPLLPQANDMLFTLALLVYDDILAQLIELLVMITLLVVVIAFGKRFFSDRTGWWAAAILLANPIVIWLSAAAYIEMGLMLYTTLSVYAFWNWLHSREQHWLVLAGAYCGIGIVTKYTALFFLAALTLMALFVGLRERKWRPPLIFAALALLIAFPWLARNFYYTHNPLFPFFEGFFTHFFGYGFYDPKDYEGLFFRFDNDGIGKSLRSLITLPWHLAFNRSAFGTNFSSLYFFMLPLLLALAIAVRRIRNLLALTLAFTLFWFFSSQQSQYLVPALPLLSIATAACIDWILLRLPLVRRWANYKLLTAMGFALLIYPGWYYAKQTVGEQGPLPITQQQRDTYLARALPSYPIIKYLNNLKHNKYSVYAMFNENMTYFADGVFIGQWIGPASYKNIMAKSISGEILYKELKNLGVDYFLPSDYSNPKYKISANLPQDSFFQSHFIPIYDGNNLHLYELTAVPFERKIVNLIQNAGFEELKNGQPTGWHLAGEAIVDSSGKQSITGQASVRCNRSGDVIYQTLSINEGGRYFFSCEAHGVKQPASVKLQANWYDKQGRILKEEIKVFEAGVDWTRCETSFEPPPHATSVTVHTSPLGPGAVWFDDFSFGTVTYEPLP